jgi:ABC-type xylose transport system permease subunit
MKICPVGAELFHVDRQTDTHNEASSHFSQSCEHAIREAHICTETLALLLVYFCISNMMSYLTTAGTVNMLQNCSLVSHLHFIMNLDKIW